MAKTGGLSCVVCVALCLVCIFAFLNIPLFGLAAGDVIVQDKNASRPVLVFACDRPTVELSSLFTPELISQLKQLGAGVALSTEDFSSARAQVVRQLNASGIPMTAWLVLPQAQGYYVNANDAPETAARFAEFDRWTRENGLHWEAVGLDIEPNFSEFASLKNHKWRLFWMVLRRAMDSGRVRRVRSVYQSLIQRMQADGYSVQTYQLMFIVHDRKIHSTLLERIFGIVDVRGNQEALMLYSSFAPQLGAAMIWQFGTDAQLIAVGSTASSGDPAQDASSPPLNWNEFSRDLLVAHHFSPVIGVYSLEGCVRQGFMPRLLSMDWGQPIVIPAAEVERTAHLSEAADAALWLFSHIFYFLAAFILILAWLMWRIVHRRKKWKASI